MKAGDDWRIELTGPDPAVATDQVFLNVLYPTDLKTEAAPRATLTRDGTGLTVTVGGLSYTFE